MRGTGLLPPSLQECLERQDWACLAQRRQEWPEVAVSAPLIVEAMEGLGPSQRVLFFRALPGELQAEVVARMDSEQADRLLVQLTDPETRQLLDELSDDDRATLLQELPGRLTHRLMRLLTPEQQREVTSLLGYPEGSVGRLMTSEYIRIKPHWTVGRALEHIRERGQEMGQISMIYVTAHGGRLVDALTLRELVLARPESLVENLMDRAFVSLSPNDHREKAVHLMRTYGRSALPVVDEEGFMLGIVTFDDVFEAAEEEVTEDFQKIGGVAPLETEYSRAGVGQLVIKRLGWLVVLLVVNLLSGAVIGVFEEVLAANIALAFFIPLLIDTAGNAGAQVSSMMVRGLSTGDVKLGDWLAALLRELGLGLSIGVTLAVFGLGLGWFRGGAMVGVVVSLTLLSILTLVNTIGALLPFLLSLVRLDPAVASAPLITSIADALGLLIYFHFASLILGVAHG